MADEFPIRCFSCGAVINPKYARLRALRLAHPATPLGDLLDQLRVRRYCCRRHFLGHHGESFAVRAPEPAGNSVPLPQ